MVTRIYVAHASTFVDAPRFFMFRFLLISMLLCVFNGGTARAQYRTEAFTEAFHKVELSPAEPGILARLFVAEGDAVKAGDPLAALDARVLEVSLKIARQSMQSQGRLKAAKAERDLKAQRLEKLNELKQKGYSHSEEIERAVADVEVAEANVLAATEQLAVDALEFEKIQAELEQRTLRSPINGVVAKVHHEEREFITAPNSTVLTVVQLDPLRIVFPIPTEAAVKFRKDQRVPIRFSETGTEAVGRIETVLPITDAESGMVRVKVLLDNPDNQYRCGVRVTLDLDSSLSTAAKP